MNQGDYTLNELTDLAGVSTRTVRYYISEGLLPPPETVGPRATYSQSHLDRLLLIGQLKDAYLPLREIRRRLNNMTDWEVREAVDLSSGEARRLRTIREDDDAGRYLREVIAQQSLGVSDRQSAEGEPFSESTIGSVDSMLHRAAKRPPAEESIAAPGSTWRRIELGPDVELLVRDDAFDRNLDRINWLVNWAKRVFR